MNKREREEWGAEGERGRGEEEKGEGERWGWTNFHMLIVCCGRGKKGDERTGSERNGRRGGE